MAKDKSKTPKAATKPGKTPKPMKSPGPRRGKGVLFTISLMLILSALMRVGEHAGAVLAREEAPDELATPPIGPDRTNSCDVPDDIAAVVEALSAREARLTRREDALDEREATMDMVVEEIDAKLAQLALAEQSLQSTISLAETALEDDLTRLTSVYENMKPDDAAPLFEAMDPQFAAGFLNRMRPDVAAGVMAKLDPESAYSISILMASRNANAPRE